MTEETLHLIVRGRVQGVGFRWFVADEARRLALRGWVRNNSDGSVEIRARGPNAALQSLESHVRRGPPGSRVSDVERAEGNDEGSLDSPFAIVRG